VAKRFTDTDKWKDDWFLELEPTMKIFWIYMLDTCDHAGIWKVNFKLASYCLGAILDRQSAEKAFKDRITVVSEDKWHIPKFISFQNKGKLNPKNKAHLGVVRALKLNGIDPSPFLDPSKPLSSESTFDQRGLGIGTGVGIGIGLGTGVGKDLNTAPEKTGNKISLDAITNLFNDKLARKVGRIEFCRGLSADQLKDFVLTASYADFQKWDTWVELMDKVAVSPFLTGQEPGKNFIATLDWLVIHGNALKVLNGKYPASGESSDPDPFADMKTGKTA
jgi:hypothetical protein